VRLFLQIPPENAKRVVGTLWATGVLTRAQYERNMKTIDAKALDNETVKNKKWGKLMSNIRGFYKQEVKNDLLQ